MENQRFIQTPGDSKVYSECWGFSALFRLLEVQRCIATVGDSEVHSDCWRCRGLLGLLGDLEVYSDCWAIERFIERGWPPRRTRDSEVYSEVYWTFRGLFRVVLEIQRFIQRCIQTDSEIYSKDYSDIFRGLCRPPVRRGECAGRTTPHVSRSTLVNLVSANGGDRKWNNQST